MRDASKDNKLSGLLLGEFGEVFNEAVRKFLDEEPLCQAYINQPSPLDKNKTLPFTHHRREGLLMAFLQGCVGKSDEDIQKRLKEKRQPAASQELIDLIRARARPFRPQTRHH